MNFNEEKYAITSELKNINERQITFLDQENTNGESWEYYCTGQIVKAVVHCNGISGTIREYLEEFNVEITVDEHEIISTCSCGLNDPVCKHVISLLYSWVNDREDFINIGNLVKRLYDMDKQELIEVMERIFQNDPAKARFIKKNDFDEDDFDENGLDVDGLIG